MEEWHFLKKKRFNLYLKNCIYFNFVILSAYVFGNCLDPDQA